MYKLLLFAGTTEGRELAEYLAGCKVQVTACVATEYGETLINPQTNLTVHAGRMDRQQMKQLMQQEGFDLAIDATHPYAAVVTQNIAAACQEASVPLYRCLRESEQGQDELEGYPHLLVAQDTEQAAHLLEEIEGNILLTTGSKELPAYRQVKGFAERFYPRVLPLANVVESCLALGIPAAHLIAMQGPFSQEMNLAMIRQWNISCLVTKESGKTGGVDQKLAAAKQAGISVLLIRRPSEQVAGWSLQALKQELAQRFGIRPVQAAPKPRLHRKRFPLFVSLYGKRVLVVGGGKIAARRARVLACFGCRVQVIAPKLSEKMEQLLQGGEQDAQLQWICRSWQPGDCTGQGYLPDLALAATDDPAVNTAFVEECHRAGIPVNRCDCHEECDFYFPAIVEHDGLVIGIASDGTQHKQVKQTAARFRELLCSKRIHTEQKE